MKVAVHREGIYRTTHGNCDTAPFLCDYAKSSVVSGYTLFSAKYGNHYVGYSHIAKCAECSSADFEIVYLFSLNKTIVDSV